MPPTVRAIRRYPVKSMGGEDLTSAEVDGRGLKGDRGLAVVDGAGKLASGKDSRRFRRRDAVFDHRARTMDDGSVEVHRGDHSWTAGDPALDDALSSVMDDPVRVLPEAGVPHQDAGQVSLVGTASLSWCAAELGVDSDPRRLRVNLVIETTTPFVEEEWAGRPMTIGSAGLAVVRPITRCRMIDLAQDGSTARHRWLRPLADTRDMRLAVYLDVVSPGTIALGDAVVVTG